ncbi:MAG: hypothetical protein HY735_15660 [Verrucomicrobia bacterium]|nr:hypothetical protein [Verrucomicrobiota bacterium]
MRKLKLTLWLVVGLTLLLLGVMSLRDVYQPTGNSIANLAPDSGNPPAREPVTGGRFPRRSGTPWPLDRSVQAPEALSKTIPLKSRCEELLESLKAMDATARLDAEQLGAILEAAASELSGAERTEVLNKIAALIADRDLDLGFELVEKLADFRDRHGFVKAIVESVVELAPDRAAGWALRLQDSQLLQSACSAIGMKWGQMDREACRTWAESLSDPTVRLSALEGLTWAWTLKDPTAAYDWAAQLPESEMRGKIFVKMSKLVTARDPQHGSEWALRFPEGPGRSEALDYAVFQWASKDLQAAAAWAVQIQEPQLREGGLVAVARSWSNSDPERATAWAAQLAEGPARTSALMTTVRKWAEGNPADAARWIDSLPQLPARAEIFESVTSALKASQPSAAEAWLKSVFDPDLHAAGLRIVASEEEQNRVKP